MMDYLRMDTRIKHGLVEVRFLQPDTGKKKGRHRLTKWRSHSWYPPQDKGYAAKFAAQVAMQHVEFLIHCYEIHRERRKDAR
jgi:hypothetical protein